MSSQKRFSRAYSQAVRIPFDDRSRFVLFSDVHRGDNSFADDFANNRNVYFHALNHYLRQGYTYFELGDGDELWEVLDFTTIREAHSHVFELLREFYKEGRFHRILGNHDMVFKYPRYRQKYLHSFFNKITGKEEPLFPGITLHEGLVLQHTGNGQELFLLHGHQAEWMNYHGWKFNRFLVRVCGVHYRYLGLAIPLAPQRTIGAYTRRKTKQTMDTWKGNLVTITGHTHRPRFPEPGEIPLFNDGSCVHPRSITGLEITDGSISLIKWHIATAEDGTLKVVRKLLEGPQKLADYHEASRSRN